MILLGPVTKILYLNVSYANVGAMSQGVFVNTTNGFYL